MAADYRRYIYRQLCEETEKAERLECENRQLRNENTKLHKKVAGLEARLDVMAANLDARIEAAANKAIRPMQADSKAIKAMR